MPLMDNPWDNTTLHAETNTTMSNGNADAAVSSQQKEGKAKKVKLSKDVTKEEFQVLGAEMMN